MVRGVAALAVMLSHVRVLFFVPYAQVLNKNALVVPAYLMTSLGHEAVLVFFALSGFFISRSVLNAFQTARWSWTVFLVNRLTRLLLVLLPGLLLCALWDYLAMYLPCAAAFYDRTIPGFGANVVATNSSLGIFVGNLFFLQSIYYPPFGSNMPLWSLSYEFWYYMLFPTLLIALLGRSRFTKRFTYGVLAVAIILMVGRTIAILFLVWLTGTAVGLLHDMRSELPPPMSPTWTRRIFGALGFVALFLVKKVPVEGLASDFLVAAAFVPVMYCLVGASGSVVHRAYAATAKMLASFSYTLYLVHLPLLIFLRTLLGNLPRWQPDLKHAAYGVALAALVGAYALVISRFTEARTDAVRRMIFGYRAAQSVFGLSDSTRRKPQTSRTQAQATDP